MTRVRNPELKRKKIIQAALQILRDGQFLTKFSLDEVARAAEVSKGGLIHHFPSKEALLIGVAQSVYHAFEQLVREGIQNEPPGRGRILRSYIKAVLSDEGEALSNMSPVLLSYGIHVDGLGSRFDYWREILEQDGLDPVIATKIRLTVDGVLYTEMIDGRPIDRTLRRQIGKKLLEELNHATNAKRSMTANE